MYYDTAQFVMDVEDRFDIAVPDVDAERICTMGDLCDYLANRAGLFLGSPCPTASAFYKTRRSLVDRGALTSTIRRTTNVSSVLTPNERLDAWRTIGDRFGTVLPSLRWRWRLRIAFCVYVVASLSLISAAFTIAPDNLIFLLSTSVISSIMLIAGYAYASRFASVIPPAVATVGTMSRWLVDRCYLPTNTPDSDIDR